MAQPAWMKKRTEQVVFLRQLGYDSAWLAHADEKQVEAAFKKEKENQEKGG